MTHPAPLLLFLPPLVGGILLVIIVLGDTFETIVLPRHVGRNLRLTRLYYTATWRLWSIVGRSLRRGQMREQFLSVFGPLSLITLIGLWATLLVVGFALMQWGLGLRAGNAGPDTFAASLYLSGVTLFTLGYGDFTPKTNATRTLAVVEAGFGFALLATVIGYLPVIYQAFSRREVGVLRVFARAGSPPSALAILTRYIPNGAISELTSLLAEYEIWCGELSEGYTSYPVLAFYRSQRTRHSWLSALLVILDVCALIEARLAPDNNPALPAPKGYGPLLVQARLTFDIATHVVTELSHVLNVKRERRQTDRLPEGADDDLFGALAPLLPPASHAADNTDDSDNNQRERLTALRARYEPWAEALSARLFLPLFDWQTAPDTSDEKGDRER